MRYFGASGKVVVAVRSGLQSTRGRAVERHRKPAFAALGLGANNCCCVAAGQAV